MADKSRADELQRYSLDVSTAYKDQSGDWVLEDDAQRIIRELEERIAAMEDTAGPITSDLHDAINRRIAAEECIRELEAENERLRREMAEDVAFQWCALVDVPERLLTPGGRSIRRQLIAAARKSLQGEVREELQRAAEDCLAAERERDAALAHVKELEKQLKQADADRDHAIRNHCAAEAGFWSEEHPERLLKMRQVADVQYGDGTGARLFPEPMVPTVTDRSGNGADLTQHCDPPDNPKPLWWPDDEETDDG